VRHLAVLAERFAVIGDHGDHGVGLVSGAAQPVEDASELGVRERDLAVVEPPRELCAVRLRRSVRCMRVVDMQPREERSPPRCLQPANASDTTSLAARCAPAPGIGLSLKSSLQDRSPG
jgi:hypothetical protein